MIHKTAIISEKATIGENVEIGPFAIIEDDVIIGNDCKIGAHAVLADGTRLSDKVTIYNSASISTIPQDLKFDGEKTTLEIGEGTVVREFTTLNRGTSHRGKTVIGKNCLLMAYSHVAHDCIIGNNCIFANGATLGGHVVVGDFVNISAFVLVHQFTHIGSQCMIMGGSKVNKDIPPYIRVMGEPIKFSGLNTIGMKRRNFSKEVIESISDAYKILFRSGLNTSQGVEVISDKYSEITEVKYILDFINGSERGILR